MQHIVTAFGSVSSNEYSETWFVRRASLSAMNAEVSDLIITT